MLDCLNYESKHTQISYATNMGNMKMVLDNKNVGTFIKQHENSSNLIENSVIFSSTMV